MTSTKENLALNYPFFINLSFSLFPICFIFGNLITNINFFIFCFIGILHLKSKILTNEINFPLKLIFSFFILVLFSTSLNFVESLYTGEYEESNLSRLIKSILFFRFFLVLLILYFLSEFEIINYKFFFISAAVCPVLVSLDVIFQYIFGFNTIGIKSLDRHNPSFFGDELISGGYIKNFSFFSIFFLSHLIKKDKNFSIFFITILTICVLATGAFLSGNKMPFYLFIFGIFILFIIHKNLRKILLTSYCVITIIFTYVILSDENFKYAHAGSYNSIKKTIISIPIKIKNNLFSLKQENKESEKEKLKKKGMEYLKGLDWASKMNNATHHDKLVASAIEVWKLNKILGGGIKWFRTKCRKISSEEKTLLCSNHPHNYYFEILSDLGIVGIILSLGIGVVFLIFLLKNYRTLKDVSNIQNLFLLSATVSLFLEMFPLRSSGSIFTTNNATYIIIMASIVLSYKKLLNGKNFK